MVLDLFLSILKNYEEKVHDMLSLMLDPRFEYLCFGYLAIFDIQVYPIKNTLGKMEKKKSNFLKILCKCLYIHNFISFKSSFKLRGYQNCKSILDIQVMINN
jgi:hypothetical protein